MLGTGASPDLGRAAQDPSGRAEAQLRKHVERIRALRAAEHRVLEMIADGARLTDVLNELCRSIDAQSPGMISTIVLMEPEGKKQLWQAAGPRVPREWLPAISPRPIGPRESCCGSAAHLKKRVIISDISTDPLWPADSRDLAIGDGIRAGWSEPILTKNGELLGAFALYAPKPPTDVEFELIEGAAHIAVVAITRQRSLEALKNSEAELRRITDAIPHCINVITADGRTLYANRVALEYAGVSIDDATSSGYSERVFHPDDVERSRGERQQGLSGDVPFELEQRLRRHDGTYRWFLVRYTPCRDENGRVVRWYAAATDIHDRKHEEERVRNENLALRDELDQSSMFEEIVGSSDELRRVLEKVAKVAPTDSTVLILGETGTGKELIARAIHKRSRRAAHAFIRVNCAAIPASLVSSELFGHEKGAFTGAVQRRIGRFEAANGGTIFLDEIGDLPMETQIALLRVLQEREFERIGSTRPIAVDVRVLAATSRDLEAAVAAGSLRQDLFYRLNVFPLAIPPLRERQDDVGLLVQYLIDRYANRAGKKIRHISKRTLEMFRGYQWPGNVRELQNVVERAVILCDGDTFAVDESWLMRGPPRMPRPNASLAGMVANHEREIIEAALAESRGRVAGPSGAAAKLGMPRQTLDSKIRALHIDAHRFKPAP